MKSKWPMIFIIAFLLLFLLAIYIAIPKTLFHMIIHEDISGIEAAIEKKPKLLQILDKEGLTPLEYAIVHHKYKIACMLLDNGANPNQPSITQLFPKLSKSRTIIYPLTSFASTAAEYGVELEDQLNVVKKLFEKGADIKLISHNELNSSTGPTPILFAAIGNNISVLKTMLEYTRRIDDLGCVQGYATYVVKVRTGGITEYDRPLSFLLLLKYGSKFDPEVKNADGVRFIDLPYNKQIKELYYDVRSIDSKIQELEAKRAPVVKKVRAQEASYRAEFGNNAPRK